MATGERDFRERLDVKTLDARGRRLATDGVLIGTEQPRLQSEASGGQVQTEPSHNELKARVEALEKLIRDKIGGKDERSSSKANRKNNRDDLLRSGVGSDNPRKSDFYRSSSSHPGGKSKERELLHKASAQGQPRSGQYDPKIERDVKTVKPVRLEDQRLKLSAQQRTGPSDSR